MLSMIYVSEAKTQLTLAQVEAMAQRAAQNNAVRGVTGLLAYNGSAFMQLLEGEDGPVLTTMSIIERDPRHGNISYIRQETRSRRECPEWSMRAQIAPLIHEGSATRYSDNLPASLSHDTLMLFTSFASAWQRTRVWRPAPVVEKLQPIMA